MNSASNIHDFEQWMIHMSPFLNITGLEVGKQRLLSAHLPFLPASISESEKMSYLSSCISFDSPLMVSHLSTYHPSVYQCARGDHELHHSIIFLSLCMCVCACVCVHIRSWGQWVLFWNVWTGGEWEWSWKTAVLEFLSYSSTPTYCNTHMRVRAHTHTHGGCYHMFSIMRTLKEFCQWRMLSFCSVFSLLMSVKQAAVGCVCGIMISWYIYIYCITSSLFSLFLFIFAPVHSYLPTNQICSMWCRICHERKMLLLWNVLCFSPN